MILPNISIIMAVYNGEEYLEETMRSVLAQTFEDFEFVIVDDCSTDGTPDIIGSFNDDRIVVHTNENNLRQAASLNVGLKLARGEYIARIDADDLYHPHKLEKQMAYLKEHPDISVLGTGAFMLDERGNISGVTHARLEAWELEFRLFFESPMIHVSVVMNREDVLSTGGYNPAYPTAADYDLWCRLLMNDKKLANLPDILTSYRVMETTFGTVLGRETLLEELPAITQPYLETVFGRKTTRQESVNIHTFIRAPESQDGKTFHDTQRLFLDIADHYARSRNVDHLLPRQIVRSLFFRRRLLRFIKRNSLIRPVSGFIRTAGKRLESSFRRKRGERASSRITHV